MRPRQSVFDDRAAQIAWLYFHGRLTEQDNVKVHNIARDIFSDKRIAITMLLEIADRCGYAKSALMDDMSEVTYKKKKKLCRDQLESVFRMGVMP